MLTPSVRMTPVLGNPDTGYLDKHAVYIPFVIEPQQSPEQKKYFRNQRINILCVGKFEERKHHLMLLEIVRQLFTDYPLHLTLVGEVSTQYHKNYYQKVQDYITVNHMEDLVDCHINCPPDKMSTFYRSADLFVLPSTGEFASVSQLEAMSHSLPVIVSNTNGTACYIEEDKNGYLFKDKNEKDLKEKITKIISSRKNILQMGAYSYLLVNEKYSFTNYQAKIKTLIKPRKEHGC
ncbi:MAG: glycosyltransferase family 4 protein [Butyrivibrio sp.]|nr:glycosyltransferase family 4 protein [Butyrivibrio sp.]